MELASVIPWGRSLEEYRAMFNLSENDLDKKILGCADGPASFNAELTQLGGNVVSVDPVYQFTEEQIRSRLDDVYPVILSQVEENQEKFVWSSIEDVNQLGEVRMAAMLSFLSDYQKGSAEGRYLPSSLPDLPFQTKQFDLALCSHFLFLYSDHVDCNQHIKGMRELCRVASEVRVYPLLNLAGERSPHIDQVVETLESDGLIVEIQPVDYEFQKGATEMLVVKGR